MLSTKIWTVELEHLLNISQIVALIQTWPSDRLLKVWFSKVWLIDPENKSEEEFECLTTKVTFIPVIQPDDGVIVNVRFPSIYDPLFSEDIDVDKVGKS